MRGQHLSWMNLDPAFSPRDPRRAVPRTTARARFRLRKGRTLARARLGTSIATKARMNRLLLAFGALAAVTSLATAADAGPKKAKRPTATARAPRPVAAPAPAPVAAPAPAAA